MSLHIYIDVVIIKVLVPGREKFPRELVLPGYKKKTNRLPGYFETQV
jgi:hypothetical protein